MFSLVLASAQTYISCRSDLNSKYLRCVYTKDMHRVHDESGRGVVYMEASAERVVGSARTRFILEPHDANELLVRVRCAYNKTYWVPQEVGGGGRGAGSRWIVGTTTGLDGLDLVETSSTVFKIVHHQGNSIRLYHPDLRKYACIIADHGKPTLQLRDEGSMQANGDRRSDSFTINPVSPCKELPEKVIFKGDNGRYLKAEQIAPLRVPAESFSDPRYWEEMGHWYLQFGEDDKSKASVLHTTYTNDEGQVCIKSEGNGKFWRHEGDFVELKSTEDNFNDRNTLFKVVPGNGFTALQNVGANRFCKRLSSYGHRSGWDIFWEVLGGPEVPYKESCLSACSESIMDPCAQLHVEEPIHDRKIFDIDLHVDEARYYNMSILRDDVESHPNISDLVDSIRISREKEVKREGKWETSLTMKRFEDLTEIAKMGVDIPIPKLGGNITLSTEVTHYKLSESFESHNEAGAVALKDQIQIERIFSVPPKTLLKVIVQKQYHCDIPYSYKQTDMRFDGKDIRTNHDDGVYSFTTSYFEIADKFEPLR